MYDLYQSTVYDLAQQAGFRFQVRNTLSELDLEPALRVVIALPPDPGPGIARWLPLRRKHNFWRSISPAWQQVEMSVCWLTTFRLTLSPSWLVTSAQ